MLEEKVKELIEFKSAEQRIAFHIDYLLALEAFKRDYPVRQGLTERYALNWVLNYLSELNYTPLYQFIGSPLLTSILDIVETFLPTLSICCRIFN